jgi:bud site selection protein 31
LLTLDRDVLEDYEKKMRDAENESHEGKRKVESVWWVIASERGIQQWSHPTPANLRRPIMRLSHARSRYIYDLYYKRELISRELYDWLLKQKYADAE